MGLWGRLFGESERMLTRPADLDVGDMVRFKLYAPGFLAGSVFEVSAVNTYEYEAGQECEFVLKGVSSRQLYLTVDTEKDRLRLSVRIVRDEVEAVFDMNVFPDTFDREEGEVRLNCRATAAPKDLDGWCADTYIRTAFAVPAYFFDGDFRKATLPEDSGEGLDYYALTSGDERHAVEIEVFDGEEDVLLTLIAEPELIEELLPAGNSR